MGFRSQELLDKGEGKGQDDGKAGTNSVSKPLRFGAFLESHCFSEKFY